MQGAGRKKQERLFDSMVASEIAPDAIYNSLLKGYCKKSNIKADTFWLMKSLEKVKTGRVHLLHFDLGVV